MKERPRPPESWLDSAYFHLALVTKQDLGEDLQESEPSEAGDIFEREHVVLEPNP